jgi:hypothetical protein
VIGVSSATNAQLEGAGGDDASFPPGDAAPPLDDAPLPPAGGGSPLAGATVASAEHAARATAKDKREMDATRAAMEPIDVVASADLHAVSRVEDDCASRALDCATA